MKKKIIAIILLVISAMFMEYRFIMTNLSPYIVDNNTIYIEFMGQVDEYNINED
jgi:hypothetical protein